MKKLLTLAMLGAFSFAIVGCEASGQVGDTDHGTKTEYKKTTYKDNGDTQTTKTEIHHDNSY